MGEKLEIHVLDIGFLVKNKDYTPIAAFTSVFDLTTWLHDRFGPAKASEAAKSAALPKIEPAPRPVAVQEQPEPVVDEPDEPQPEPEPATSPDPPSAGLSPQQEQVYAHLRRCLEKTGGEIVEISIKTLAAKADVPVGSMYFVLGKLQDRGLIEWIKRGPNADPQFKVIGGLEQSARAA